MYDPKQHTAEENKINFFNKKTTKELEKELKFLHNQDFIGGFDAIEISNELFKRRYSETDEIETLIAKSCL